MQALTITHLWLPPPSHSVSDQVGGRPGLHHQPEVCLLQLVLLIIILPRLQLMNQLGIGPMPEQADVWLLTHTLGLSLLDK
jgi:hypothetical protein